MCQNGKIAITTIAKNACLYIIIAFVSIVVQVAKTLISHIIISNIIIKLLTIVIQGMTYVNSQRQTNVTVDLCTLTEGARWHLTEIGY